MTALYIAMSVSFYLPHPVAVSASREDGTTVVFLH